MNSHGQFRGGNYDDLLVVEGNDSLRCRIIDTTADQFTVRYVLEDGRIATEIIPVDMCVGVERGYYSAETAKRKEKESRKLARVETREQTRVQTRELKIASQQTINKTREHNLTAQASGNQTRGGLYPARQNNHYSRQQEQIKYLSIYNDVPSTAIRFSINGGWAYKFGRLEYWSSDSEAKLRSGGIIGADLMFAKPFSRNNFGLRYQLRTVNFNFALDGYYSSPSKISLRQNTNYIGFGYAFIGGNHTKKVRGFIDFGIGVSIISESIAGYKETYVCFADDLGFGLQVRLKENLAMYYRMSFLFSTEPGNDYPYDAGRMDSSMHLTVGFRFGKY